MRAQHSRRWLEYICVQGCVDEKGNVQYCSYFTKVNEKSIKIVLIL